MRGPIGATALDIVLWPEPPVDPIDERDGFRRQVDDAVRAGATMVNLRFRSNSLAHHLELMEAALAVVR